MQERAWTFRCRDDGTGYTNQPCPELEDPTSVSAPRLPLSLATDCPGTASPKPRTRQYDRFMSNRPTPVEPRWPVILALAAVVVLHFSLPAVLSLGPNWVLVVRS